MNKGKSKLTVIQKKREDGLYVWMSHNGQVFKDNEGNVMNIPAFRNDINAMNQILKAAKYYGAPDGKPHFIPGARRISDQEHANQVQRMKDGMIPDELDVGAYYDAARGFRANGNR
jgi:hypothetical protein